MTQRKHGVFWVELGITRLHDELDGLIRLTVSLP